MRRDRRRDGLFSPPSLGRSFDKAPTPDGGTPLEKPASAASESSSPKKRSPRRVRSGKAQPSGVPQAKDYSSPTLEQRSNEDHRSADSGTSPPTVEQNPEEHLNTENQPLSKEDILGGNIIFAIASPSETFTYEDVSVSHEGTCGRCGRKLTFPDSIKNGFGPNSWSVVRSH